MDKQSFTEKLKQHEHASLELVTGHDNDNNPIYALVLVPSPKVPEMRRALQNKDVVLENFGEVVATGAGHEPPQEMLEDMVALMQKKV